MLAAAAEPARRTVAERAERRMVEGMRLDLIEKRMNRTRNPLFFEKRSLASYTLDQIAFPRLQKVLSLR
jgi:cob(I)alamin adenosyltransferase